MLQLLLASSLVGLGAVTGHEYVINNMDEFLDFAQGVNGGILFRNTTVLLETDLDFSGEFSQQFEPIGINDTHYFPGTFDGQGHVISNLVMNSSLKFTGLFGYSDEGIIRNVVIDSSCSITSSYADDNAYVGGIIGSLTHFLRGRSEAVLESIVNLGNITFNGQYTDSFYRARIGGIAGSSDSYYTHYIKNCINYGTIKDTGLSSSRIGGIVGLSEEGSIYNCLNHGEIASNGKVSGWRIGGIVGYMSDGTLENCVNDGKMSCTNDDGYVGSIVGYIYEPELFSRCYWNEEIHFDAFGKESSTKVTECATFNNDFVLNETVTIGSYTGKSLLDALNAYTEKYRSREYSHWLTNKDENAVSFTVNDKKTVTLNSQVILLPSIANGNKKWFDGWYTDKECTAVLETFTISGPTDLYAKFGENNKTHKITFDTRGGSPIEAINVRYHEVISLPRDTKKDRYALSFWKTELGDRVEWDFVMPSYDITLYAVWAPILISNAEELVEFSKAVNYENVDYSGTTVYLESDIAFTPELSCQFEPIGKKESSSSSISSFFNGTFDGQGHSIKGLVVNVSYSKYTGLFGYSDGLTIRNVVMDESCSVVPRDDVYSNVIYVGGIIGKCKGTNGPCIIENCINKMKIVSSDSGIEAIGGIAGEIDGSNYERRIENCTNYGAVVYNWRGYSTFISKDIAGILGSALSYCDKERVLVKNCDNYGPITFNGKRQWINMHVDGIVGTRYYVDIEGCSNYGKITEPNYNEAGIVAGFIVVSIIAVLAIVGLFAAYTSLVI